METVKNWFNPANREKIYTAIAALAPILVTAGVIASDQVEPILIIVAALLQVFGGILALSNLKPTEAARWFGTVGRGIIYGLATTVAGALVALGVFTQDWSTNALTYASFGLTALAAILAVVTPKEVAFSPANIPVIATAIITPENAVVVPVTEVPVAVAPEVQPEPVTPPVVVEPGAEPVEEEPVAEQLPVDQATVDTQPTEVPVEPDTSGRGDWN